MPHEAFLHAHAGHAQWRMALDQCLAQLQGKAAARKSAGDPGRFTLGWCYLTDYYAREAEAILAALRERLPGVAWVGTVGVGVCASGVEYFDQPALVLMLSSLPREAFRVFSGQQPLRQAAPGFTAHTALVHGEGSTPDLQELLREMSERTATGYLFGGLASARTRTLQIADGVFTGGLSGVAFAPGVGLVSRVTQGCQPVGPERTVTRAEESYVLALDGRPALECVLEDLGLERRLDIEEIAEALATTLVGLSTGRADLPHSPGQFGADTLVRHIVGVDPEHQVLAIAEEVEVGSRLAFCRRNAGAARADLARIATEVRLEIDSGPARALGALYVSCSGRGGPHFGAPHAELLTVRESLGDLPLVGFFAGGEIARSSLYGYTGVLTVFTAAAAR